MESKLIKITDHKRQWVSRTIHHSAIAEIENYVPANKNWLAEEISIKAGYHPAGYGLYDRYTSFTPSDVENHYLVKWQTSDSCD